MRHSLRTLLCATLWLGLVTTAGAQTPDPSGHWEGTISAPFGEILFEVDLARNAKGELAATYSQPQNNLKGYPLTNLAVKGTNISFEMRAEMTTKFEGVLLADGTSISGSASAPIGSASFVMSRKGDAHIEAPPKNAAIVKALEGTWNGTLQVEGREQRLVLRLSNQPDGTSAGTIMSVNRSVEFPLGLKQAGATLTLSSPVLGGEFFAGTLNAAGTELAGTFTQQTLSAPLTFQKAQ